MRFFQADTDSTMPVDVGADSLKKPHHIATLWFSEVVNNHPNRVKFLIVSSLISSFSILVNRAGRYQQKNAHQTRLTHEPMETGVKPWALNTENILRSSGPNFYVKFCLISFYGPEIKKIIMNSWNIFIRLFCQKY